jgi:tRNA dimethylallyltransferase
LAGERTHAAALAELQQATRNYAKRQITWFRHQLPQARIFTEQFSERLAGEFFPFIRKVVDPKDSTD